MQIQSLPDNLSAGERLKLATFTLICFLAFTYNLSEVPPYHADENFYVTSTRDMIDSGDYITPTYHGEKRFAKPILFYWLVAASYRTFGTNLFSARLVSTVFGALCIPIIYIMARRMFDSKTAIISALLLPGCYLHFQIARWAITDMVLNFFVLLAFYFFVRGFQDESNQRTNYYLAYLSMGIGFMAKGPPAVLIPAIVIGGFIFILRDWKKIRQLRIGQGAIILITIIFPWFAIMLFLHGDDFKNHILGAEFQDRIMHKTPFSFYYVGVIIRYYLPWSLFFLFALVVKLNIVSFFSLKNSCKKNYFSTFLDKLRLQYFKLTTKDNLSFLFCLLWVMGPLLLFTLLRIEHSRYMLISSPAIAMITANYLSQLIDSKDSLSQNIFKVLFFFIGIFYFLIALAIGTGIFILNPIFTVPLGLISLTIIIIFGLVLLFSLYKLQNYFAMIITLSILQIVTLTLLSGNALSFFNRYPMKAFAEKVLTDPQVNKKIGLYQAGSHRARMGVLTGLPSINLKNEEELLNFIRSEEDAYIVMRQSQWEKSFSDMSMVRKATDFVWKKPHKRKVDLSLILKNGFKPYLDDYSESYILLKTENSN